MKKILLLVDETYEDLELWYPRIRLEEAGFHSILAGPVSGQTYTGKHGYPCKADISFKEIKPKDYQGVVIPGGYAPDRMRRHAEVLKAIREFDKEKKCIAFICHAGWVPISAKILKGRKATSFSAIKDDMENAGVHWSDEAVVVDHNLISSRSPADLPHFLKEIIKFLS